MSIANDIEKIEAKGIHICLVAAQGEVKDAAEIFGLDENRFRYRLKKYNFDLKSYRKQEKAQNRPSLVGGTKFKTEVLLIIYRYLERHNWNRDATARDIGVSERTMRSYVNDLRKLEFKIPERTQHSKAWSVEVCEHNKQIVDDCKKYLKG